MSFFDNPAWKSFREAGEAVLRDKYALVNAKQVMGMERYAARRELARLAKTLDDDAWRLLILQLDNFCASGKSNTGFGILTGKDDMYVSSEMAEWAGELAEYAESLRVPVRRA
jgi:hypothetical protein